MLTVVAKRWRRSSRARVCVSCPSMASRPRVPDRRWFSFRPHDPRHPCVCVCATRARSARTRAFFFPSPHQTSVAALFPLWPTPKRRSNWQADVPQVYLYPAGHRRPSSLSHTPTTRTSYAMAEYRDAPVHDIPVRMKGKGEGNHPRPKPHIDEATYKSNYQASITKPDGEAAAAAARVQSGGGRIVLTDSRR